MASPRTLNMISRWHGLTSASFLGLFKTPMSRLNSTRAPHLSASGGIWITAFETVMQDLYGAQWKEKLTRDGRKYVHRKERRREKTAASKVGSVTDRPLLAAQDNYDPAAWHQRAQKIRARILQEGNDARVTPEAIAEAQKAHSEYRAEDIP